MRGAIHRFPSIPSRIPVADEERPNKGEVSVFLDDESLAEVDQFLRFFRAPPQADRGWRWRFPLTAGLRASGSWKDSTGSIHFVRTRLPAYHGQVRLAFISSYLGSTAKNLRLLFEHAASRPCVLFLDEFDAIAKMRDDDRELGELKRVVISLMQNIDAMGRDHVLIAATNHHHLLDPAIWRRFSYKVELREPGFDLRSKLVQHFCGRFADESTVEIAAALTEGLAGDRIKDLCDDSIRQAVLAGQHAIDPKDVIERIAGGMSLAKRLKTVRSEQEAIHTEETRGRVRPVAVESMRTPKEW